MNQLLRLDGTSSSDLLVVLPLLIASLATGIRLVKVEINFRRRRPKRGCVTNSNPCIGTLLQALAADLPSSLHLCYHFAQGRPLWRDYLGQAIYAQNFQGPLSNRMNFPLAREGTFDQDKTNPFTLSFRAAPGIPTCPLVQSSNRFYSSAPLSSHPSVRRVTSNNETNGSSVLAVQDLLVAAELSLRRSIVKRMINGFNKYTKGALPHASGQIQLS
ncbi:hypothetical protein BDN72DRAFT_882052 [Pluteus cervinus]|uniref:Uncharacterized protein n=1 Tax=Pluteus cervinus TaxID=181527 RepID=A0ACD3ACB3_9AGAR|nr:hypothetical protein BDN72DRAFT_882052 [Pluteus cervinus]